MIWVGLSAGVDVIWIDMIMDFRMFAPNFFNFRITLAPRVFENYVASRVFNSTSCWTMTRLITGDKIQRYTDRVEEVEDPLPGNLWVYASGGSRWVHTNDNIAVLLVSDSSHFIIILQNSEGYALITVSLSANIISRLVGVNERIFWTHSSYQKLCIPYSYNQQRYMFHPIMVGVIWLISD